MNKTSPLNRKQRAALAARIRKGKLSDEDRALTIKFLESLTWHDGHFECIDPDDGTIQEVWP